MSELRAFTVYRDRWLRGDEADGGSALLNGVGKQCCLGFLASACGIQNKFLLNARVLSGLRVIDASQLPIELRPVPSGVVMGETDIARNLYQVNDTRSITETRRELIITDIFRNLGIEVIFKDTKEDAHV